MAVVVSDTSPLRALTHLNQISLLGRLFGEVLVPPAVAAELVRPMRMSQPLNLADHAFIKVRAPRDRARVNQLGSTLDPGESEAIALALGVAAPLLIDEAAGRAAAKGCGLKTIGVLGVLVRAKRIGASGAVGPLIDRLRMNSGFSYQTA